MSGMTTRRSGDVRVIDTRFEALPIASTFVAKNLLYSVSEGDLASLSESVGEAPFDKFDRAEESDA
jgi:hypothetical protein